MLTVICLYIISIICHITSVRNTDHLSNENLEDFMLKVTPLPPGVTIERNGKEEG